MWRDSRWKGVILCVAVFGAGIAIRLERTRSSERRAPAPAAAATAAQSGGLWFTEVAREMGIHFVYRDPLLNPLFQGKERLFFWGSGAGVADVDGDGWMDLLLPAAARDEKNHLYLNQGGARFRESAGAWGIADNDPHAAVTSAVFFDYDNDGAPDLYLAGIGCSRLLHNTGARFEDVSAASGLRDCANAISAVPLDWDGDGLLDLYVLRYWNDIDYMNPGTSRIWPENHFNAVNGGRNTLFRNLGNGRFEDVTARAGGGDTHWTLDAAWADLAGDGTFRLYLANDFGADVVYSARDHRLFDDSAWLGVPDRRFGMGVSLGDVSGDGAPHVFVSNEYVSGYDQTGNFLWKLPRDGVARDEAPARGVDRCGWAWGSLFADFDLDGREDLYVANGFITGKSGAKDMINSYYDALRSDYAFTSATLRSAPGMLAMEFKNWPAIGTFSYAGNQVDCLFLRRGDRFEESAQKVGLTDDSDGRAVAGVDFDNNGSVDLLVTTQNGAPLLLRNEVRPGDRWIGFRLIGGRSNRDAVGARIELKQGPRTAYRWATAGRTGFLAGSDPRLHFGLSGDGPVDVRVRWPSGAEQALRGLGPGRYHVVREGDSP